MLKTYRRANNPQGRRDNIKVTDVYGANPVAFNDPKVADMNDSASSDSGRSDQMRERVVQESRAFRNTIRESDERRDGLMSPRNEVYDRNLESGSWLAVLSREDIEKGVRFEER